MADFPVTSIPEHRNSPVVSAFRVMNGKTDGVYQGDAAALRTTKGPVRKLRYRSAKSTVFLTCDIHVIRVKKTAQSPRVCPKRRKPRRNLDISRDNYSDAPEYRTNRVYTFQTDSLLRSLPVVRKDIAEEATYV